MKLIKTIVRANKVEDVREALGKLPVTDMTVTAVRGQGQRGQPEYPGSGHSVPVLPNALIELVVRDEIVAAVIQTITRAARIDEIGDGHVSVLPLDQAEP